MFSSLLLSSCLPPEGKVAGRRSIEKRSWSYTWVEGNPGPPGGCPEASADDQELQWPSGVVPPWGKGTWPLCFHISQSATTSCLMGGCDPEKAFLQPRRVPKEGLWSESSAAKNAGVTWWGDLGEPPLTHHHLPLLWLRSTCFCSQLFLFSNSSWWIPVSLVSCETRCRRAVGPATAWAAAVDLKVKTETLDHPPPPCIPGSPHPNQYHCCSRWLVWWRGPNEDY